MNKSIPGNAVAIRSDCERLEKCLQLRATEICNLYTKTKGRRKYEMIKKCMRVFVKEGEVASVETAMDDVDRWKIQCDQLEKRVASLYEEMVEAIGSYEEKIEGVQDEIQDMKQQLYSSPEANTGKPIIEVEARQARRQLNKVKTYTEKALWFADIFGLKPTNLELRKVATGSPCCTVASIINAQISLVPRLPISFLLALPVIKRMLPLNLCIHSLFHH